MSFDYRNIIISSQRQCSPTTCVDGQFFQNITLSYFLSRRKQVQSLRSPNAFLIYRKAFLDQLSHSNHNIKMTEVSKVVSYFWKNEKQNVKDAYKEIAKEVENELIENRKKDLSTVRVVWKNSKLSRKRKQNVKCSNNNNNHPSNNPLCISFDEMGNNNNNSNNSSSFQQQLNDESLKQVDSIDSIYEFVSVSPPGLIASPPHLSSDSSNYSLDSSETTPILGVETPNLTPNSNLEVCSTPILGEEATTSILGGRGGEQQPPINYSPYYSSSPSSPNEINNNCEIIENQSQDFFYFNQFQDYFQQQPTNYNSNYNYNCFLIMNDRSPFLGPLFNDIKTSDILLRIDNIHFHAHVCVLSVTSRFWNRYFRYTKLQKRHDYSCLKSKSITKLYQYKGDPETELNYTFEDFGIFLKYLYGYPIEEIDVNKFFVLAYLASNHKFDVPELLEFCDQILYETWGCQSWRVTLRVSKWIGLIKLRFKILKYIYSKGDSMFLSYISKELDEFDWKIIYVISDKDPCCKSDFEELFNIKEYEECEDENQSEEGIKEEESGDEVEETVEEKEDEESKMFEDVTQFDNIATIENESFTKILKIYI
ncbi:1222_t:CDS:2 [Diversispora eburnea]|uniref:1222_t:CDS:1 n=1 Tax=Diversispora eburnea TaxID=1213867 RepID=A0A9N8W4N0_9GLOM|nr:1222_t:CDS:2 [Diversispora eburnea]